MRRSRASWTRCKCSFPNRRWWPPPAPATTFASWSSPGAAWSDHRPSSSDVDVEKTSRTKINKKNESLGSFKVDFLHIHKGPASIEQQCCCFFFKLKMTHQLPGVKSFFQCDAVPQCLLFIMNYSTIQIECKICYWGLPTSGNRWRDQKVWLMEIYKVCILKRSKQWGTKGRELWLINLLTLEKGGKFSVSMQLHLQWWPKCYKLSDKH